MGYGSLAYDFEQEEVQIRIANQKKIQQAQKRHAEKMKNIKRITAMLLFSVVAYFMVSKYVVVYDTQVQIKDLEKQLSTKQSYTSQKIFELEQSIDLTAVEQQATTRLGMRRPEKHQTIYVNVQKDNVTEVTAGSVEGFNNKLANAILEVKNNIISIFTMK